MSIANKVKGALRGIGPSAVVGLPIMAFETLTGLIIVAILLVPVVLMGMWSVGRIARTDGLEALRDGFAKTQAKNELERDGIPIEDQDRDLVEEVAARIRKERRYAKRARRAAPQPEGN